MKEMKPMVEFDSARDAKESSFESFFLAEYDGLVRAMSLFTENGDEGEELAQEAMARAYERWDRVHRADNPTAYVYTIAFNLRRRNFRTLLRTRISPAERATDLDFAGEVAARADVRNAIRGLTRKQREALLLVEWLGLTPDEAGHVLNVSPVSVRVRLHRARNDLRRVLGGSDD
jgi:RNA polymerase sigma-70 factor (ECF subfamily)